MSARRRVRRRSGRQEERETGGSGRREGKDRKGEWPPAALEWPLRGCGGEEERGDGWSRPLGWGERGGEEVVGD